MSLFQFLARPLPVGRLFGIPLFVAPAMVVLTLMMISVAGAQRGSAGMSWMFAMLAILAFALLAHEFGHALAARRLGVRVADIRIGPMGGVARLEDTSSRPELEALIALAGPAVNLGLAGIAALLPGALASQALWMNLVLGAGNLLPAFPLDGGRILRAWMARRVPLQEATHAAVRIANFLIVVLFIAAALGQVFLLGLLLGVYLFFIGHRELVHVIARTGRMPSWPLSKVLREAFRAPAARVKQAPPRESATSSDTESPYSEIEYEVEAEATENEELEQFHGSLSEYFRLRRRKGPDSSRS